MLLRLVANLGVNRSESKALAIQPGRDLGSRQSTAELRHDGGEYHLGVLQLTVLLRELGGSKCAFAQARGRLLMRQGPRFAELLRRFGPDPGGGVAELLGDFRAGVDAEGLAAGRPSDGLDRRGIRRDGEHDARRAAVADGGAHVLGRVFFPG